MDYVTGIIDVDRAVTALLRDSQRAGAINSLLRPIFLSSTPNEITGKFDGRENRLIPLLVRKGNRYHLSNGALFAAIPQKNKQYTLVSPDKIVNGLLAFNRSRNASLEALIAINVHFRALMHEIGKQMRVFKPLGHQTAAPLQNKFAVVLGLGDILTVVQHPFHPNHVFHWATTSSGQGLPGFRSVSVLFSQAGKPSRLSCNTALAHRPRASFLARPRSPVPFGLNY